MTARTRSIRKTAKPRVGKYLLFGGFLITIAFIAAFVTAGINLARSWLTDIPDYSDADAYLLAEPSTILDTNGNVITEFYAENRIPITIDQCSEYVLEATVCVEDERFYDHEGVDLRGILRAFVAQLTGGSEGASTITQQLVRNTILQDEQFEKTLSRKVREAYISLQLEKMFTKDEILMMYLNTIYYGQGCFGIEAAAETFFGKTCAELTLAEAATLAGLPQSPSAYDPTVNPDLAIERRNVVLGRLLANGKIAQEEYDSAIAEPLTLHYSPRDTSGESAYPYFVQYVTSELHEQFSSDTILKGGLTIQTTLDPAMQQDAEDAVNNVIGGRGDGLEAGLIAIENGTGYIRAMIGGRDFAADQYNVATQAARQPGSSFKTFTLTAAIQAGMNPNILLNCNSGLVIGDWTVNNIDYGNYGTRSLTWATQQSSNTAYAQVIHEIGAQSVVDTAHAMGITSDLDAYDSLTLGTSDVTVLEMASAYSTLATGGVHYEPTSIIQVLDRDGNVLYQHQDAGTQVISPEVAHAVTNVLETVITNGTGAEAALWVDQPVAGKTGTTDSYKDLWFVGYTPQLSCAVWVGYRTPSYIDGSTHTLPNPIFRLFMSAALEGQPRQEFPSVGDPVYLDNSAWSISRGTYVEPVYTDYTDYTDYSDTTVTAPTTDEPTYTEPSTGGETGGGDVSGGGETGGGDTSGGGTGGGETGGGDVSGGGETGGGDTSGGGTGGGETGGGDAGTTVTPPAEG